MISLVREIKQLKLQQKTKRLEDDDVDDDVFNMGGITRYNISCARWTRALYDKCLFVCQSKTSQCNVINEKLAATLLHNEYDIVNYKSKATHEKKHSRF